MDVFLDRISIKSRGTTLIMDDSGRVIAVVLNVWTHTLWIILAIYDDKANSRVYNIDILYIYNRRRVFPSDVCISMCVQRAAINSSFYARFPLLLLGFLINDFNSFSSTRMEENKGREKGRKRYVSYSIFSFTRKRNSISFFFSDNPNCYDRTY